MSSSAILAVKILGDAKDAKRAFNETEQATGGLKASLASFGAAAAGAVAAAGAGLLKLGQEWGDVTRTLRAGTGATGEALRGLQADVKLVASNVPDDLNQVGQTVADLNTRLGLAGEDLQILSENYLKAGRLIGEAIDVRTTTAAFSAFGIAAEGTAGALDELFDVSQATGVGMNELAQKTRDAAPIAQQLGLTFRDTAGLIGQLDKAGVDSTRIVAGLNKSLVALAKSGEDPAAAFRRVTSELQGYIDTGQTAKAIGLSGKIFGTKGAPEFVAALERGVIRADQLAGGLETAGDTIADATAETLTLSDRWGMLWNRVKIGLEPIATILTTTIADGVMLVANWIEGIDLTPIAGVFSLLADGVRDAIQWLGEAGKGMGGLWSYIEPLVPKFQEVWGRVVETAAAAWEFIKAAVTTGVGWIVYIWEVAGPGLMQTVQVVWDGILSVIGPALDLIKGVIATVTAVINGDWSAAWEGVKQVIAAAWELIKSIVTGALSAIWTAITGALGSIGRFFADSWDRIKTTVSEAFTKLGQAVTDGIGKVVEWVGSLPSKIITALGDTGRLLWDAGKQILTGFWDGLKSVWSSVTGWVSGITDWIKAHKGPIPYDRRLLVPAGIAIMSGLANGLRMGFGAVEQMIDHTNGALSATGEVPVTTRAHLGPRAAARAAGTNVVIHIHDAYDPDGVARRLREMLDEWQMRRSGGDL